MLCTRVQEKRKCREKKGTNELNRTHTRREKKKLVGLAIVSDKKEHNAFLSDFLSA